MESIGKSLKLATVLFYRKIVRKYCCKVRIKRTNVHDRCSRALRDLHFDWTQDPEVVLSEILKTIDLETDYLKTDSELFEGYCRKLYLGLEVEYHQLLDLVASAHFRWQTNTMLLRLKCGPTHA